MRRMLVAGLFAALLGGCSPTGAALPVGAVAPDFTTQASLAGKAFSFHLADALRKGPVVLYFYPAAFTSGCTAEAHDFAQATPEFAALGATVIGVSADPIDTLNRFSVSECRSKFAVAAAPMTVIDAYDVKLPILAKSNRTSFVIGQDGKIVLAYSALDPDGHVARALAAVRGLKKGGA